VGLIVWFDNQDMGRPSNREERRRELVAAFARVLADHGYAGATIAAVAGQAGVAPGLVHHHFESKEDLLEALLQTLLERFRARVEAYQEGAEGPLMAYVDGALKLDARADLTAARCWVGLFAEAVRNPRLFARVRSVIDTELLAIQRRSRGQLSEKESVSVLAFIIGSLVLGSFAPKKTAGSTASGLRALVKALTAGRDGAG